MKTPSNGRSRTFSNCFYLFEKKTQFFQAMGTWTWIMPKSIVWISKKKVDSSLRFNSKWKRREKKKNDYEIDLNDVVPISISFSIDSFKAKWFLHI